MKNRDLKYNGAAALCALIWGTAFVAQSVCTDDIPPFAFNALRGIIASVFLLAVSAIFDHRAKARGTYHPPERKSLIIGGICCGVFLTIASNLQQVGLADTAAGKAGFITALYIVLVPIFGVFLGHRTPARTWAGVLIAVAGLYFLCVSGGFTLQFSDMVILLCAVFFAMQILCIEHFVKGQDAVKLSIVQFLTVAVLSTLLSAIFETPTAAGVARCVWPLLYVGVFSSGVAYTLQIYAEKGGNTVAVTVLMSLESVFSVIAGAIILHDKLSAREYLGCILMFAAVILTQLPSVRGKKQENG